MNSSFDYIIFEPFIQPRSLIHIEPEAHTAVFVDNAALPAEPLLDGFDYRQTESEMEILVLALL